MRRCGALHVTGWLILSAACGTPDAQPTGDPAGAPGDAVVGGDWAWGGDAWLGDALAPGDTLDARCGASDYDWLPASSTGQVLEDQLVHDWDAWSVMGAQAYVEHESGFHFNRLPQYGVQVRRIRYQTQDRGQPLDATGMVIVPNVSGTRAYPLLLFLHGTCGFNDLCSPSLGIEDNESATYTNAALMALFASWGYVVAAPDFIGLKSLGEPSPQLHPYLIAEPTALASLDAVRAARAVLDSATGGRLWVDQVVVWGASQGGHAAAFTVRYAPYYAPELEIAGAVYAIPPTNLLAHTIAALQQVRKASANTVVFMAVGEQWYGPLAGGLSTVLNPPFDTQIQPDLMASCFPSTLDGVTELDQLFSPALLEAVATQSFHTVQPWYCMAQQNSLPSTAVARVNDVPGLMILAERDDLVDPTIERESFITLCSQGERLAMLQCAGASHTRGFFYSIDDALDFLDARLAGLPLEQQCVLTAPVTCANTPD